MLINNFFFLYIDVFILIKNENCVALYLYIIVELTQFYRDECDECVICILPFQY